MLVQNRKGDQNYPVILILPYFAALLFMILYISKDTWYYHLIRDYFYLPDFLWRWFFFFDIGKSNLIRLMNLSGISIVIISTWFAFSFRVPSARPGSRRLYRAAGAAICIYGLVLAVVYDPWVSRKAYYFLYPAYLTVPQYHALEKYVYSVTRAVNICIVLLCLLCLLTALKKAPRLRLFQLHYLFLAVSYGTLTFVYVYFISSCPNFFISFSKISGTHTFRSIPLGSNALIYRAFPYILIPAAALVTFCACRLTRLSGQNRLQELKISKQISSSETTSKIFCHYIKNEILALQSEVDSLREEKCPEEKAEEIHAHLESIYERIDELHRSTKTGGLNLEPFSLKDLITGVLALFTHDLREVDLRLNLPQTPVCAMIDPVYMEQALHNIIRNSIDAMEDRPSGQKKLTVTLAFVNRWIKIDIGDSGRGISEENLDSIFLPFYSSHPYSRHWGVGLTLTYKVIHAHEGKIVVTSAPGQGTNVQILLPNLIPAGRPAERK